MKKSQLSSNDSVIECLGEVNDLAGSGEFSEALKKFEECEKSYPDNINVVLNKAGFLINIGSYTNDSEVIERGILAGETCLEDKSFADSRGMILYNTANGLHFRIGKYFNDNNTYFGIEEDVKRCVAMYREAFELTRDPNAAVNLGNLFDEMGRPLEAMAEYERAIRADSAFGMAYGNKAVAVKQLSQITEYQGMYLAYAYQLFNEALKNEESIIRTGGYSSLSIFKQGQEEIRRIFEQRSNADLLEKDLTHPAHSKDGSGDDLASYTQFCLDNDLYLTLHIFDRHSEGSIGDNISSSFISSIGDEAADRWVKEAFMRLNEIKESYITGRYILWQSQQKSDTMSSISQQSLLVNNLDYTAHNIYTGLLKSAYKEGFSALDKIANLVNYYLNLEAKEKDVSYRKIWFNKLKQKNGYHPTVLESNYRLFGLYSALDELGGEPSSDRNSMEHRYFRVGTLPLDDNDAPTFQDFTQQTSDVYYKIKCAIVYLLNFINYCEDRKHQAAIEKGSVVPSMPVISDQWLDLWK
ncbi:MAG TPA: LA2681 family HEPN domain-containing protein [Patescibacteria group bacterium]|jgi:tetratricopeptide (TPR) repeat protein|nr:LA2681 family HEPN domain-containing protein [Patescibacteria group bacterium]